MIRMGARRSDLILLGGICAKDVVNLGVKGNNFLERFGNVKVRMFDLEVVDHGENRRRHFLKQRVLVEKWHKVIEQSLKIQGLVNSKTKKLWKIYRSVNKLIHSSPNQSKGV